MKHYRFLTLTITTLLGAGFASAQTAEEIIAKYIDAIGGKDQISRINSLYMEGTVDAMGNQGTIKTTQVNGKGFKQEVEVAGTNVVMCYTDSMGWQINPMTGIYTADNMPENQYRAGKDNLYIGGPFMSDYKAKGYSVELAGRETVGSANAYKIKVISPEKTESGYFFDPDSYLLLRISQSAEMMGQTMEIIINMSDYRKPENGFLMPFTIETNYGGQFSLTSKINKVEVNQPVEDAVFVKPVN